MACQAEPGSSIKRSHVHSCWRFAAFLGRSPDAATADAIRRFRLHPVESGLSFPNRNRIMTWVSLCSASRCGGTTPPAEVYHNEPQKLPLVMSPEERLLAMAGNLKVHVMLALGYGCGSAASTGGREEGTRAVSPAVSSNDIAKIDHRLQLRHGDRIVWALSAIEPMRGPLTGLRRLSMVCWRSPGLNRPSGRVSRCCTRQCCPLDGLRAHQMSPRSPMTRRVVSWPYSGNPPSLSS
jgi:hypothetical protein